MFQNLITGPYLLFLSFIKITNDSISNVTKSKIDTNPYWISTLPDEPKFFKKNQLRTSYYKIDESELQI